MSKRRKKVEPGGKRVTILFNARDWEAIKAKIEEREKERGYPVTVSDALRELVQEKWSPAND